MLIRPCLPLNVKPCNFVFRGAPDFAWKLVARRAFWASSKEYSGARIERVRKLRQKYHAALRGEGYIPNIAEFVEDDKLVNDTIMDSCVQRFARERLLKLESAFEKRRDQTRRGPARENIDFGSVAVVDAHVHAAAIMTPEHLLSFIKRKLDLPDIVFRENHETLRQVFLRLGITHPERMTIRDLKVRLDGELSHDFRGFNKRFKLGFETSELQTIFLKPFNDMNGAYFAELLHEVAHGLPDRHFIEPRISVYGDDYQGWERLAEWMIQHGLLELQSVHWAVQVPRIYMLHVAKGAVTNYLQYLENLFQPLMRATLDPDSNAALARFLATMGTIDSVDDESIEDPALQPIRPEDLIEQRVSYQYELWHLYENVARLNAIRLDRGLNTFRLRPHTGELGSMKHLSTAYLLAESISHGLNLKDNMALQYLFYLDQVPVAMSPTSNKELAGVRLQDHPIGRFHKIGLNVCPSTDDPLMFQGHTRGIPLLEEYDRVKQTHGMDFVDLAEMKRRSVLMSDISLSEQLKLLGLQPGETAPSLNNADVTRVPQVRHEFRQSQLVLERAYVREAAPLVAEVKESVKGNGLEEAVSKLNTSPAHKIVRIVVSDLKASVIDMRVKRFDKFVSHCHALENDVLTTLKTVLDGTAKADDFNGLVLNAKDAAVAEEATRLSKFVELSNSAASQIEYPLNFVSSTAKVKRCMAEMEGSFEATEAQRVADFVGQCNSAAVTVMCKLEEITLGSATEAEMYRLVAHLRCCFIIEQARNLVAFVKQCNVAEASLLATLGSEL